MNSLVDRESERGLVAACMLEPRHLDAVMEVVAGADFLADPDLGNAFDVMITAHLAGLPVNEPQLLLVELEKAGVDRRLANIKELTKLFEYGVPSQALYYARRVEDLSTRRRMKAALTEAASRLDAATNEVADVRDFAVAELEAATYQQSADIESVETVAEKIVHEMQSPTRRTRIVYTGLRSYDELFGGWAAGELIVLAARPGLGKTSLAQQVAMHNARRGRGTLFVSLEMTSTELAMRSLCGLAGVTAEQFRAGRDTTDERAKITSAKSLLDGLPLRFWDPSSATVERIRAQAKREKARGNLDLLIVDYIGLIKSSNPKRDRYLQVGEITAELKRLAKELSIPVLALSQLNRQADGSEPQLSHLRESGAIEQDADVVTFIHPDDKRANCVLLIVAKHRHGEPGTQSVRWIGRETRFADRDEVAFDD